MEKSKIARENLLMDIRKMRRGENNERNFLIPTNGIGGNDMTTNGVNSYRDALKKGRNSLF